MYFFNLHFKANRNYVKSDTSFAIIHCRPLLCPIHRFSTDTITRARASFLEQGLSEIAAKSERLLLIWIQCESGREVFSLSSQFFS